METQPNIFEEYHNTTNEKGKVLATYSAAAKAQDIAVLRFFQANPRNIFTPFEVFDALRKEGEPITSYRRAITDLTDQGYLIKTATKKKGGLGRMNYCWKLNVI